MRIYHECDGQGRYSEACRQASCAALMRVGPVLLALLLIALLVALSGCASEPVPKDERLDFHSAYTCVERKPNVLAGRCVAWRFNVTHQDAEKQRRMRDAKR